MKFYPTMQTDAIFLYYVSNYHDPHAPGQRDVVPGLIQIKPTGLNVHKSFKKIDPSRQAWFIFAPARRPAGPGYIASKP